MSKRQVMLVLAVVVAVSLVAAGLLSSRLGGASKGGASKIALIYVDGVIVGGRGNGTNLLGESGGTDAIMKQLRAARDDATVKAVVLRINSPGGSAPAAQEVGEEIAKVRQAGKVVVASMGDTAASGGYWLAATTDKIYANPATLTGSIGVYIPYTNLQSLYQKIGISQERFKSGPHKDILSPDRPVTPEERAIVQGMVDDIYNQFVQVVAQGRKMDPARVRELADGRIYTGRQAKDLGLVDELGGLDDAIQGAAQLAGLPGKPEVKEFARPNPWQALLGLNSQAEARQTLLLLLRQLAEDTAGVTGVRADE